MPAPWPLESLLHSAFPPVRVEGTITPHECEECAAIRDYLCGKSWQEVEDSFTEQYCDSLPLLSPVAYHAYLPAWLRTAVRNPDGGVAGILLINLADEPPLQLFQPEQARALLAVARHVATRNYWGADDPANIERLEQVESVWAARSA